MGHISLDIADSRRGSIFSGFIVVIEEIGGAVYAVLVCLFERSKFAKRGLKTHRISSGRDMVCSLSYSYIQKDVVEVFSKIIIRFEDN